MTYCNFEVYEDDAGEYRWRFKSGRETVTNSDGYSSKSEAKEAIELLQEEASDAKLSDDGKPRFELYKDQDDEWRWRMVASDGATVTDAGDRYASKHGAQMIIRTIKTSAGRAEATVA